MIQKKYALFVFTFFILSVFILSKVDAINNDLPLLGRIIFVDPGHGGYWKIQKLWNDYKC